jgi:hypothetical protein
MIQSVSGRTLRFIAEKGGGFGHLFFIDELSQSHCPDIAIAATRNGPKSSNSWRATRLIASQRNSFMRQIQNPAIASDAQERMSAHTDASLLGSWVGGMGFGPKVATANTAG